MRIVQLANFWTPTSGGLRVVLDHLATGYAARGHRVLQVVPGARDAQHLTAWGRRTTVAAPTVPGAGGYRMIVRLRHVERLVHAFGADVVEVSDRATLAHLAGRFAGGGIRVVLVAHERLDHIVGAGSYGGVLDGAVLRRVSDGWNPRCWRLVDEVVTPSRYAADEWHRIGIRPRIVPWGVDTTCFRPPAEGGGPGPDRLDLVWIGRLSAEKRPGLALGTLEVLAGLGVPASLTVVGDGPLLDELRRDAARRAADFPVEFVGHEGEPAEIARILGSSSVALATSGIEAFGLTVLESMACGTPVVACTGGAAAEVAGDGGRSVAPDPAALAAASLALWNEPGVRQAARRRAQTFGWDRSVDTMLGVFGERRVAA